MRQGEVVIPGVGDVPVLHQGEVQVSIEALLQLRHVLHAHDPPDADLLALLLVGERSRHARAEEEDEGEEDEEEEEEKTRLGVRSTRKRGGTLTCSSLRLAPPVIGARRGAGAAPVRPLQEARGRATGGGGSAHRYR